MSAGKKDFYSIADLSREFEKDSESASWDKSYYMAAAMLAQAQQLAVISSQLADIAESLRRIVNRILAEEKGGQRGEGS